MEVRIPEVGESIVEVQIAQWLKAEGDEVKKDDPLAVIDSEKTTFDLPTPESGTLGRILVQAGETVRIGTVIAQIETGGAGAEPQAATSRAAAPASPKVAPPPPPPPETSTPPPSRKPARPPAPAKQQQPASPRPAPAPAPPPEARPAVAPGREPVRPTPTRRQVRPPEAEASAPVEREAPPRAQAPPPSATAREEELVPMTMLRRTVTRRLVEAQHTMAMLTTFNEVDMGAVQALRQQRQEAFQQRYHIKLGLMSFFVKAAIAALKEFPQLNAEVRGDDIVYRNYFDIGMAIATPHGLVVPVLLNAERLSFAEIETAVADFAQRAKERQLKPEELEGGTFTITNGGVFGSLLSTPLINPPQSGILGLHAITDRPVAREGQVVIRPMMYVALTYDHRIVDGREAVLFLRRIKEVIEDPARMLIEA